MNAGTDVVETTATDLAIPAEFAEFVPDDLPRSTDAVEVWVQRARETVEAIEIKTEEDAKKAVQLLATYRREDKRFEDERVDLTKPRRNAADFIKKQFDKARAPFVEAATVLDQSIAKWEQEEAARRAEAQRLIDQARRAAEAKARTEREAAEKAAQEAADLAAESDDEEDAAVAAELQAEAERDAERAGGTERAILSVPPDPPPAPPKLAGLSRPQTLVVEVVDPDAVPDYLPDGTPLKVVDTVALRRWALDQSKANDGELPTLPGARIARESKRGRVSA